MTNRRHPTTIRVAVAALALTAVGAGCGSTSTPETDSAAPTTTVAEASGGGTVHYSGSSTDLDSALTTASVAFRGKVTRLYEDPIPDDGTGGAALSRRIADVTVVSAFRGSLRKGQTVKVWYGTRLKDGWTADGDTNITTEPKQGAEVMVLTDGGGLVLPSIGQVIVPIEGAGIGVITAGKVVARGDDSVAVTDVERRAAAPAEVPAGAAG